ncbi:MAG TPA: hypothetical protein VJY62_09590 [Bacteroidia bacterium]|nr:hypothetical protein [Bacteroidia bacterium]
MNTCNCSECTAQRNYSYRQRRNYFDPRYYSFSGDTLFNELFNELLDEQKIKLKKHRERIRLTNDKSELREQAVSIAMRDTAARNKIKELNDSGKKAQVDHIIPLEFAHLFRIKSKYMMSGFMHPNSPENLRVVSDLIHKGINRDWLQFKKDNKALINKVKDAKKRTNPEAQTDINSLRDAVQRKADEISKKIKNNKDVFPLSNAKINWNDHLENKELEFYLG